MPLLGARGCAQVVSMSRCESMRRQDGDAKITALRGFFLSFYHREGSLAKRTIRSVDLDLVQTIQTRRSREPLAQRTVPHR